MHDILNRFRNVRARSEAICAPLAVEDYSCQPCEEVSPPKWHLGHTSWFFEQIILARDLGYKPFHPDYMYLFNSYYESFGRRLQRPVRGLMTRPTVAQVLAYRQDIDEKMLQLLETVDEETLKLVETGLHHEEQHQELLLMDIKQILHQAPLFPVYHPEADHLQPTASSQARWQHHEGGTVAIGATPESFAYDNEFPRHKVLLSPFEIKSCLVSNREFLEFIVDGGYETASLWLSDGWSWVQTQDHPGPEYWHKKDGGWFEFGFQGLQPLNLDAPAQHLSYFEADAYARWAGARLPTEQEWECAFAREKTIPRNLWEWTNSSYSPYPGYLPPEGALAEYNGKFMINQMVLRGASYGTPEGHERLTYRNFFYTHNRWQFSGVRLARSI